MPFFFLLASRGPDANNLSVWVSLQLCQQMGLAPRQLQPPVRGPSG